VLTDAAEVAGIASASARGRTVINLSLGSPGFDPLEQDVIFLAFARGSVVVAAVGNDRESGSPASFPASLNHVLTVAATDQNDAVAQFSTRSGSVDVAAPGVAIPFAAPTSIEPSGYRTGDGTSFAAPIVSGAAAWIWTARPELDNTQLFDLLRLSARDVGLPGFDPDTGFGILDIPHALAAPAPSSDQQEPNDDIDLVRAGGLFRSGTRPLTTRGRSSDAFSARLDVTEDPEDVYRAWVPPGRSFAATLRSDGAVALELWSSRANTTHERGAARRRDLLSFATGEAGLRRTVRFRNRGRLGAYVYVDAFLNPGVANAAYDLAVTTNAR
jgi:hypothetical protein